MIDTILDHIYTILQTDPFIIRGGKLWTSNFLGVVRPDLQITGAETIVPKEGFVNLYDATYEPGGTDHRPAIYIGTRALEVTDRLTFPTIQPQGKTQLRQLAIPLILVSTQPNKLDARRQVMQLRANVLDIMEKHEREDNFWYWCYRDNDGSSGLGMERGQLSASGSGKQRMTEATWLLPYIVRYTWRLGDSA